VNGVSLAHPARRAWLRGGLLLLTLIEAGQGMWMLAAPSSFYHDIPTVAADPPFNEHLMTDIGGLSLALAVILGATALAMERNLTRAALAGYAVYAASHLAFHASHLDRIPPADAALLVSALALLLALALALLLLASGGPSAVSRPRRDAPDSTLVGRGSRGRPWR
jgi:hypothetical protein